MEANTGSDESGLVEYYFTEKSGNPGGNDSGWQTDPIYVDDELDTNTQYIYTVQMRDGLGNLGTASEPVSAMTSSDIAPKWFVAENGSDGNLGTSRASPFATINKAYSVAADGDGIEIAVTV